MLPVLSCGAWAVEGTGNGILIQSRFSLQTLVTDNNRLTAAQRDAAVVTTVTPGISIVSRGGSVIGSLDYALSGILYTKSPEPDRLQQSLRAAGTVRVIDDTFTVDSVATISQQSISALGVQTPDYNLASPNRTEVASLSITPKLQGRLGSIASLQVQGNLTESRSKDAGVGDLRQVGGSAALNGLGGGELSWYANLTTQRTQYLGHDTRSSDLQGWAGLMYRPDVDLSASLHGGRESSNYLIGTTEDSTIYGGSLNWTPSPRTRISGDWMHHSYGDSHTLSAEYRLARSALRYTDTQAVNQVPQLRQNSLGSVYDILFLQYASIEPDAIRRDQLVRAYLNANGVNPDTQLVNSVLANVPTIMRLQQLSYSMTGVRTSAFLVAQRSVSDRLGTSTGAAGDLALFPRVVQRGLNATITHQLTPLATVGLTYSLMHNSGQGGNTVLGNDSQMRSLIFNWSLRLAGQANVGLTLRHAQSDGLVRYRENAAMALFTQLF